MGWEIKICWFCPKDLFREVQCLTKQICRAKPTYFDFLTHTCIFALPLVIVKDVWYKDEMVLLTAFDEISLVGSEYENDI